MISEKTSVIKHAALEPELKKHFTHQSIHSGQHYDEEMSQLFFEELGIDSPNYQLHKSSDQATQNTEEIENILSEEKPDLVIVYGDTDTTLAGAKAASKLKIPIAHIEAGMRSFNDEMPEEHNRIITDQLSSLLFTSTPQAVKHLKNEGITKGIIHCGDLMKDLVLLVKDKLIVNKQDKIYCTIHRPYNTDSSKRLGCILENLNCLDKKVVFPVHPRTKKMMSAFNLLPENYSNIEFIKPQSYLNNLNNLYNFAALITDSGGMQKEAYFLQKRCITIRSETEWPETLINNWNTLAFKNLNEIDLVLSNPLGDWDENLYGDGNARLKIIKEILNYLN